MNLRNLLFEFDKRISFPGLKNLASRTADVETVKTEPIESQTRQTVLCPEARSHFAALRSAVASVPSRVERSLVDRSGSEVSPEYFVWPQARLSDFIVLDNAIENLSLAQLLERSKVPFVICDATTTAPKLVIRFQQAITPKSFTPSERREREIVAKQDNVFRQIGLPVVLLDDQSDIQTQLISALHPELRVATPRIDRGQVDRPLVSNILALVRTPIAKAASLTMPGREVTE